ncbi:MAG: lysylphosphatidylglycerol synthase transmembrane domain-containing protein [Bacteroidales bacterium]
MKRRFKNLFQTLGGALIGFIFLYFTLRDKPLDLIFENILESKWIFVVLNGCFLALTFFLRALRWRILVQNLGYELIKRRNIVLAVTMGYFVNSFTPKLGEFIRCLYLRKTTSVPVVRSLGSVVSERIYDLLVLALGLLTVFILEFDRLYRLFNRFIENNVEELSLFGSQIFVYFLILVVVGLGVYLMISRGLHVKIKKLLGEFFEAIKNTLYLRKYTQFLILTILIWAALIAMNYVALKALPATEDSSWYFAVIVLFVGGIGWALPTPGGIGTTHYFIYQLFFIFNLDPHAGVSFGILSNGLTFIYSLIFGFVALLYFFLRQKKQKEIEN